jgi:hypothetical protein
MNIDIFGDSGPGSLPQAVSASRLANTMLRRDRGFTDLQDVRPRPPDVHTSVADIFASVADI